MGEIFLDEALKLLSSDKQKERADGLADLKHILQQNKHSSKLLDLNDKACYRIFESLFQSIAVEKSIYNKAASKSSSKGPSASATRLSAYASVIRTAVDIFLRNIRSKSFRAIVEHITETIPAPGEGLWELLSVDYTKCLSSLLSYPPHIEHLADAAWDDLVDYCLAAIGFQSIVDGRLSIRSSYWSTQDDLDAIDGRSTPSRVATTIATTEKQAGDRNAIREVLTCLQLLITKSCAPTQAAAEKILQGLVDFVKSPSMAGNLHQLAISSINTVVSRVIFDQSDLARSSLLDLIPTIRRLWTTKLHNLKDELLATLMLCIVVLVDTCRTNASELLNSSVEGLVNFLLSDIVKRSEKELLQIDDAIFYKSSFNQNRLLFGPRLGSSRSEQNWTILWAISSLLKMSEHVTGTPSEPSDTESTNEGHNKRQRLSSAIEDVFRDAVSATGTRRICALQLVPFLESEMKIERKNLLIERLVPSIVDDNGSISSWTMIALASIANGPDASQPNLKAHWSKAADLTFRFISSSSTSRAACKLMCTILDAGLLEDSVIAKNVSSLLSSANLNGPPTISDSSLDLWASIARKSTHISSGSSKSSSKQICGWLREVWTIGAVTNRIQTAQTAMFARPLDLLNLFLACTNRSFQPPSFQEVGPTGLIAKTWFFFHENHKILEYLFDIGTLVSHFDPWHRERPWSLQPFTQQNDNDSVVLDLLKSKSDMFLQVCQGMTAERSHHVTSDILQIMASFCIVSTLYGASIQNLTPELDPRIKDIEHNCHALWKEICEVLADQQPDSMQSFLELLLPILPAEFLPNTNYVAWRCLSPLMHSLAKILEKSRQGDSSKSGDLMDLDLDNQFLSPGSQSFNENTILTLNRESLRLVPDATTFQIAMTIRISVLLLMLPLDETDKPLYPPTLVEYLTSLKEAELLSAHYILQRIFRALSSMEQSDKLDILEGLGEKCLQSYEMKRCETSHCLCISMITSFATSLISTENDSLEESVIDLYRWFMEALVARKAASTRVYIALSGLFQTVMHKEWWQAIDNMPSPRTSLFKILQEGDFQVKFHIANIIPTLLKSSVHDEGLYDEIRTSLPKDPDWIEGIALRLFVLARLALIWPNMLRRSTYHMFETPTLIPHSLGYAKKCMAFVSKTLGFKNEKELFQLFASQIIYTWTENQSINSMSFGTFGYQSLKEMLIDVKDEVVGQMVMRGRESDVQELSTLLGVPYLSLVEESFHKAEAYCIAQDISTPPSPNNFPRGVEIPLKELFERDMFMLLTADQFPQIVANFFKSLDQIDQIDRAYSKRPIFQYAIDIQTEINLKSEPSNLVPLPSNHQPSFRARYLLDELEFICNRLGFQLENIWTPSLTLFVCRSLLESIHPALGSLHACFVIRKIKILVCIAGPTMLRNYPFEMLLQSLRPFFTDHYCCEDVVGLFWYLLEAGKAYLEDTPRFMTEIFVSVFLTIRELLGNESSEPQFVNAHHKLTDFNNWLGNFVDGCYSSEWGDTVVQKSSCKLVQLARRPSNQDAKHLVFEVFKDRESGNPLLSTSIGDLVLSLLCLEFRATEGDNQFSDTEVDSPLYVVSMWEMLHKLDTGPEYRLWAARVIGRYFAATGSVDETLLREQALSLFEAPVPGLIPNGMTRSKARILQVLSQKLPIHGHVGLIERTLQLIIMNLAKPKNSRYLECADVMTESMMIALIREPGVAFRNPNAPKLTEKDIPHTKEIIPCVLGLSVDEWARSFGFYICDVMLAQNPVIAPLRKILDVIPGLAVQLLPYMIHEALGGEGTIGSLNTPALKRLNEYWFQSREIISNSFMQILSNVQDETIPHARLVISCILYLHNQPQPDETTIVDRYMWLDLDFGEASSAAHRCGLEKTSLLFLEIQTSRALSGARRSSSAKVELPVEFLHDVFMNIDDPDLFYGIQQRSSLKTVMEKLEHESSGLKNLLFQSAQYDSEIQMSEDANPLGILRALNSTNLQGIANTMLSSASSAKGSPVPSDSMLQAAISLQQWDVPVSPSDLSSSATVYRVLRSLNISSSLPEVFNCVDECLLSTLSGLVGSGQSAIELRSTMRTLGIITEINDVIQSKSSQELNEAWGKISTKSNWLKIESYHEVGEILSCHEALFSSIRKNDLLKASPTMSLEQSLLEAKVFRRSLEVTRSHGVSQASLKSAMSLSKLAGPCAEMGMIIDGVAKFDLANVLWDQGEMTASISMLQQLKGQSGLQTQAIPLNRSDLLVTLGHHVAEARLEKPETILQDYLSPAVKELKGASHGETAGRVYHEFATFCDMQLSNPDGLEDFKRVEQLRDRKEKELTGLDEMMKNVSGRERESIRMFRSKAKQWFDLDDREYQRLMRSREAFLQQCLENYLLTLQESDTYNNDALRFCSIWLDKSNNKTANAAVSQHLGTVPSYKFAPLMNQLSSRLLDDSDDFQPLLQELIFKICLEHPFHGMYQLFASSKSKGGKDSSSHSRFRAANELVERLKTHSVIGPTWVSFHNMNISYVRFAIDKPDSDKYKTGAKIALSKLATGQRLVVDVATNRLPPPTMKIELRPDRDYSRVPTVASFQPEFTIASGVSAPKIVTAIATDGVRYKQLFKGGNDDLRQDAIMEQVFEQVSSLLKDHQPTRQRNLGIRTYKVIPLTPSAGIIEFVPNTIPLHEYLLPAHQRYFPKDMKPNSCRKHIAEVQTRNFEQRVRTYRQVTEHFNPVMRYFFMEKFNNPDDWFSRRLAYTRSTAAISILGYVLGLGDRHGHNILLDNKTGEVVHIDLGVAFEQGRVLPVPEVVPFRLTRDLVDGFGITKTEGVFRRCCEFTLEALRQESYSIMAILDVLRYDPLYSWSVSPLRMKKMQDNQEPDNGPALLAGIDKSSNNEPSEADRALTVVTKKLSKTLSVTATVNELIQQATDEKNLALLYCGWASYA
ncbi:hypothetical protein N7495_005519 [Penicillium taxi]|uniref:uncharacterized protein n=1 Tax=Penicillium taxi TaxID=168475 RepID=UPI002545A4E6|nr:uncharacterized protein N7495_005519 [Penicillium taxi]KAJ5893828.1 hypothetical protein N7495_005519 [Penicillium taxi]